MYAASTASPACLCMIGPFPPPVMGMAVLNKCILEEVRQRGHEPLVLSVAAPGLGGSWWYRIRRLGRVLRVLIRYWALLAKRRIASVYLSLSGGGGQVYELGFVLLARCFRRPLLLHHHSYAYLSSRNPLTELLIRTAGRRTTHFVGCEDQSQRLRSLYPVAQHVVVLSNAGLLEHLLPKTAAPKEKLRTIGFLSNISVEKGIIEFLEVANCLHNARLPIRCLIAGPFENRLVERIVLARVANQANLEYIGAMYGLEKAEFFQRIDVLLFPTKYRNETAPVTLYEALSNAVPVIASDRGCIASILGNDADGLVKAGASFVARAVDGLRNWLQHPEEFRDASMNARSHYRQLVASAREQLCHAVALLLLQANSDTCQKQPDPEAETEAESARGRQQG